jgi:glycosyltransferase involved in cell wall biosynthesis
VIHAHKFGSNLWGTVIGRACGVPVVIAHEHNWSYSGNRLRVLIDGQLTGRLATRFIAVSAANRAQMIEVEGIDSNKIIVMPTAYIPQEGADTGDIRAELGIETGVPLVGVAAWLRPEKALEVMIDAHAKLSDRVPGVRLLLAGDGPCREQLEDRVARFGLGDRVHFLGRRRDVDAILRGVDAGAMSSDWEGMPLFVFECMATDTPLVATAVGGLPEVVRDGETGLLVAPRDPDALAGALERLLTDRAFAQRLAAAAAARLAEFEIAAVASRFADLYEQLFAEASAR